MGAEVEVEHLLHWYAKHWHPPPPTPSTGYQSKIYSGYRSRTYNWFTHKSIDLHFLLCNIRIVISAIAFNFKLRFQRQLPRVRSIEICCVGWNEPPLQFSLPPLITTCYTFHFIQNPLQYFHSRATCMGLARQTFLCHVSNFLKGAQIVFSGCIAIA